MTFLEILEKSNMSLKEFGEYFEIPYRTLQNWKSGARSCPEYMLKLMEYKLENEEENGIMMYVVETFDGISGENKEFASLEDAKKYFDKEVAYHKDNGYKYEFIELNRYEDDKLVETIEEA